jgi:hypothetical protein
MRGAHSLAAVTDARPSQMDLLASRRGRLGMTLFTIRAALTNRFLNFSSPFDRAFVRAPPHSPACPWTTTALLTLRAGGAQLGRAGA